MNTARKIFGLIIAGLAFWAANKISFQVRTSWSKGLSYATDHALDDFRTPWHLSFDKIDLAAGAAAVVILLLIWAYNTVGKMSQRVGEEHGSAQWAKPSEIKPFTDRDKRNQLLFTATEALSLDSRKTQRNLNVLVIGSSGSGKSRYYVMPNLAQANTSFAITDPKGELLRQTGKTLEKEGYRIRCFNLIDFQESDQFNPLAYFNPKQAEVDCTVLTENFITNTNGQKPASGDGFWEKAERALLNALIAYVYFTDGEEGSLVDVVDMLAKMQASEEDENAESEIDLIFQTVNENITDHDLDPEGWGEEAETSLDGLRFAAAQYNTYLQGAGETKKSVIISLGVRMAPLHMAQMRHLLSADTIGLDQIGTEKTALFLVIPDTHAAFNFVAAIFYEQLFETNLYLADHCETGRLKVPVQCFMDEFANIGKMPSFERKIAVMRSRGISTSIITQNYSQGKALYKDDWETIVGNCDSLLFLGGNEKSTTEYISKVLGKQTIMSEETSQSKGRSGSFSQSQRKLGRELLTADELGRIPGEKCVYILRGVRPFFSKKLAAPKFTGNYTYMPATLATPALPATPATLAEEAVEPELIIEWEPGEPEETTEPAQTVKTGETGNEPETEEATEEAATSPSEELATLGS